MSYARVETSVRTNRKFIKAGPAPSWLWLCGLLYCQDALTDGFIADETIDYLGVPNARRLVVHLEKAHLWDRVDGGWQVHDYLKHNRSAAHVAAIKENRRDAGKHGGEASGEARRKQVASTHAKQPSKQSSNPTTATATTTASDSDQRQRQPVEDGEFHRFMMAYPSSRRKAGYLMETEFFAARKKVDLAEMFAALENHIASEQWQTTRLIPGMDTWLKEERWTQRLEPPKLAGTTSKTAGNADVLRRFVERHNAAN